MAVEQRSRLLCSCPDSGWRTFFARHPDHFRDRRRHQWLDPIEALHCAPSAHLIEQGFPLCGGSDLAERGPNLIRIENTGRVAVSVKMNQGEGLLEIEMLRQPIEGTGVIIL